MATQGIIGSNLPTIGQGATTLTTQAPTSSPDGQLSTATGYQAAQLGDPTQWNVDSNQTVQGQIQGIIGSNSPLLQQAQARAAQAANSRGLLNSSLAVTAGESALYDAAMPIATQDASTYAKAAGYNADERNVFSLNNVKALNDASMFSAGEANRVGIANAGNAAQITATGMNNATARYGADIGAAAQRYSSDNSLAGTRYASDNSLAGTRYGADQQLAGTIYASDQNLAGQQLRANTDIQVANISGATQRDVAAINGQTQQIVQQLSNDGRTAVANIEGSWRNLIQTNASAADVLRQMAANLADIDKSALSPEAKAIAQQNQFNTTREAMNTLQAVSGIPGFQQIWGNY